MDGTECVWDDAVSSESFYFCLYVFLNFDLRGNMIDCAQASAMFVTLFKNSQCNLSYHNSSFSAYNINGL